MKMIFDLDMDRCCACGACAVACMDQNDIEITEEPPLRKVFAMEGTNGHAYISMACMHCEDAPCIVACPVGCLSKDERGLTVYDSTSCIGCHSCAMACPFGAPTYNRFGKMQKCDGCAERLSHGLEPACVRTCSLGALKVYTEEEYAKVHTERSLRKIAEKLV
jgi:anaerobic dimethyl sulfoxide reductase subunit B (iron-sulfur subunit)